MRARFPAEYMRFVVSSDWHADWMTHGVDRGVEIQHAVDTTVEAAIAQEADAYVFSGDLCNPDSGAGTLRAVELAIKTAMTLQRAGIPSLWLSGNHDILENGTGDTTLSPMRSLHADVHVFETGQTKPVKLGKRWLEVLALPYPSATKPYDFEEVLGFHEHFAPARPNIDSAPLLVLSHLTVPGVQPGEEAGEMARGRDVVYPIERVLKLITRGNRVGLLLQGHYHRQQSLNYGGIHMHIPGSLARLTFGEEFHRPGFLVVDI